MFTYIVGGPIDPVIAGLAMAIMFITLCIFFTSFIVKHRTGRELTMQFEIDKIRLHNDDAEKKRQNDRLFETAALQMATDKDVQFRRIESGLVEHQKDKSHYDNG